VAVVVAPRAHAADAPVVVAAKGGDASALRSLVRKGADVNAPAADGTTALHWAVQRDDDEMVGVLLAAGARPSAANRYGMAPLQVAATVGNPRIVQRLLEAKADPNTANADGESVLMLAARTGNPQVVRQLIAAGAEVDAREGWKGQTALMWAAAENNPAAMQVLLEAGADANARSLGGVFTPLLFAIRAGHIPAARVLLDAGVDVNAPMPEGTSPLLLALINAHFELAGFLLDRGADPKADAQGWTALHQVVWSRRPNTGFNLPGPAPTGGLDSLDLVRKLVKLGADVNARQTREPRDGYRNQLNRIGATPFLLAAKSVDLPLMRLLLELGADPRITTEDGTTALMAAAGVGIWAPGENPGTDDEALAAVKLAYEVGGGAVNAIDRNGETAVHGAVYRAGSIAVLKFLIEKGARLDVRNEKGWTPLIVADGVEFTPAVLKRYPETAAFLRQQLAAQGLPVPPPLDNPPGPKSAN
jgi:ankyrin repeat protein